MKRNGSTRLKIDETERRRDGEEECTAFITTAHLLPVLGDYRLRRPNKRFSWDQRDGEILLECR
jgi:hypothetical protein